MKPRIMGFPAASPRLRAAAAAALAAGTCLIIAGCAGSGGSAAGLSGAASQAHSLPASEAVPAPRAAGAPHFGGAKLSGLPVTSQAIIYTASLTLRSGNVSRAAALASQLATTDGGYVASENTSISPRHPGRSTVSIELKIPVSAYRTALAQLSSGQFGRQLSLRRSAQDVTQTVADVTSRVASARAAITQLRALLARAGSVPALLDVQNQISSEESGLESLLAQQRALSSETSYATVSVLLEGKTVPVHRKPASGFVAGLAAGWRAFVRAAVAVATGLGAALPFLAVLGILGFGGYRAWRWRSARRTRPPAAV